VDRGCVDPSSRDVSSTTMTSRSDMDTIVVTYDVQIYEYNKEAECIIEERIDENKKMIKRTRKCENDQLFICKLCKVI
jgi:hypothetical protein